MSGALKLSFFVAVTLLATLPFPRTSEAKTPMFRCVGSKSGSVRYVRPAHIVERSTRSSAPRGTTTTTVTADYWTARYANGRYLDEAGRQTRYPVQYAEVPLNIRAFDTCRVSVAAHFRGQGGWAAVSFSSVNGKSPTKSLSVRSDLEPVYLSSWRESIVWLSSDTELEAAADRAARELEQTRSSLVGEIGLLKDNLMQAATRLAESVASKAEQQRINDELIAAKESVAALEAAVAALQEQNAALTVQLEELEDTVGIGGAP